LVGEIDERAGSQLEDCYAAIMENEPMCKRMSIENAELAKIAVNSFVTTKITFANMLAELCERIPGGDIDAVTDALGADARIGSKYLKGALGYGGPCFPRDNVALGFLARALGTEARLAEVTDETNRRVPHKFVEWLRPQLTPDMTVAVLGLAYKPHSHVIEESQGMSLALALAKAGVRVVAYDPLAGAGAQEAFKDQVLVLDTLTDCLAQADVILITNADPEFRGLRVDDLNHREGQVMVVDFWRILETELGSQPHIRYVPIGHSIDEAANRARLEKLWSR
jgi:UDPglucose 6-dehydrogenase